MQHMAKRADRQPDAGQLIQAYRLAHGLRVQDFCDLVSKKKTRYGRVNLDRTGLWRIEVEGLVPEGPRKHAIASVLTDLARDADPDAAAVKWTDIWSTPNRHLVASLIPAPRKAAA